jgi:hypothetical protein
MFVHQEAVKVRDGRVDELRNVEEVETGVGLDGRVTERKINPRLWKG